MSIPYPLLGTVRVCITKMQSKQAATLQDPHCAGIPRRNTCPGWHLENHSPEKTMPKSHSKGGERGRVGHGSPVACIRSPTKGSHYHMRGAKLPWVGGRGTTCSSAIMVRQELKPPRQTPPGRQTLKEMARKLAVLP